MRYGKLTWEDVIIGIIATAVVLTWAAGIIKGWW
jgi:hypothetical protein